MSAITDEKLSGIGGKLPPLPKWGVHRQGVDEVDEDPTTLAEGVNAAGWDDVWADVLVEGSGTHAVATLEVFFWSEAATVTEADGVYTYAGGWVPSGLSDVEVSASSGGHGGALLVVAQRAFYLKVKSLGSGAVVHVLVAGRKRVDL